MYTNPITGKKHREWNVLHRTIAKKLKKVKTQRGGYDQITQFVIPRRSPVPSRYGYSTIISVSQHDIIDLFRPALEEEFCTRSYKRGYWNGVAINHDLYGYDPDQGVAVIQARRTEGHKYGKTTHKTYFLCGRNEITGDFFRHPIGAHAIRAAVRKNPDPANTVRAAQRWMWEVTEKQLKNSVRQGDVLLVPERKIPKTKSEGFVVKINSTHGIMADEIRQNGRVYALNPTIVHTKGQHASRAVGGWVSVRAAREASAWNFASRIGD